ncbi:PA2169 family four-helix-bundle protein [Hymenobacter sp. GOD-10R]|uniref:ferritin-like domain-containing protein n=1 Tax=Hymenobacter sp. GOD-10R TaxID=3093922 RepID=UPI002D76C4DA|nr:PA2169 family four-helix-bundle protein [Hymenobacter sp. GOD-10R]WRQ30920.1 PA2169 family four-helix-bundle protein [Hymenobacter sp. GOD-10R]
MNQPQASQQDTLHNSGSVLDQAQQWLNQSSVTDLLDKVPQSVKGLGTNVSKSYSKLSTTQKVVGGTLLALGIGYLIRNNSKSADKNTSSDEQTDNLHELLLFVNDRIEGYKRAVEESQDPQLSGYYKQLVSQSQRFSNELNNYLRQQNGDQETSTTLKGKLYRAWMDTKAAVTGADEEAILGSNIYGEEWAIKAYKEALSSNTLPGSLRLEVERQYAQSKKTYKDLKKLKNKVAE